MSRWISSLLIAGCCSVVALEAHDLVDAMAHHPVLTGLLPGSVSLAQADEPGAELAATVVVQRKLAPNKR